MPEGPELHLMGVVVNDAARGRLFRAVRVSEVTRAAGKNPLVEVPAHWTRDGELRFRVSASTRGKELQLALRPPDDSSDEKIVLLLHCGMTGHVVFVPSGEEHDKHAHLILEREDGAALTFVDPRRFGRWEQTNGAWGEGRSPCALTEFEAFRAHVLASVELPVFARTPICELLLDQQFFNGVGNYLRAEILFRARVSPFVKARRALQRDVAAAKSGKSDAKDPLSIVQLVRDVQREVVEHGFQYHANPEGFEQWLRCYGKKSSRPDGKGRTIWYDPSVQKSVPKLDGEGEEEEEEEDEEEDEEEEVDNKPEREDRGAPRRARSRSRSRTDSSGARSSREPSMVRARWPVKREAAEEKSDAVPSRTPTRTRSLQRVDDSGPTVGAKRSRSRSSSRGGAEAEERGPNATTDAPKRRRSK